ncbi:DUF4097 family beta strand repeat-containing protein [Dyadobacter frigoris]|uniref:DUF4097 domain-containing protein n=1 Tax=Dyadobacter frigoris TaxID=2576211 RepID=A0A4U6D569_9BACT|nr:DUF4097 family beta strand repeat-containing protein [Dyadobacter frigoris]TKT92442.1 DUF4097 domain-containing protein [Dyadobacter frigoris]GLU53635.1 hypothetical protein Dfri01_30960 [Dyadobacter frigoris]
MKKIPLLIAVILWLATHVHAQEYKTKLANSKDQKVLIEMNASEITIEGTNTDEISIVASSKIDPLPERAKGLKPVYYGVEDNTGIGLSVTKDDGAIKIEKAVRMSIKYTIRIPKKVAIKFQETNWQGGSRLSISNMDGDLEVSTLSADIDLLRVSGPVVANSTSGSIKVIYENLNQAKPSAISTVSGSVDVTLPASVKSNLNLHTINGEIYTDFDLGLKNEKNGMSKISMGSSVKGATNGGGVEIQLNTISNNIYIRKQK